MKWTLIAAAVFALAFFVPACFCAAGCSFTIKANVEVAGPELSLADLLLEDRLSGEHCPGWLGAARRVRLGSAPLEGSVRVLEGSDVRVLLLRAAPAAGELFLDTVPDRISVRRAGRRASCADIARAMSPHSGPIAPESDQDAPAPPATSCGAADRISRDASLEQTKKAWISAGSRWLLAECVRPADCVPFLVRGPVSDTEPQSTSLLPSLPPVRAATPLPARNSLIRPGQKARLLWDEDGIRLLVPAISLDRGEAGETVRARILRSGRIVRAIVTGAGELKALS